MTDVLEVMNRELMMELYEVKKKLRIAEAKLVERVEWEKKNSNRDKLQLEFYGVKVQLLMTQEKVSSQEQTIVNLTQLCNNLNAENAFLKQQNAFQDSLEVQKLKLMVEAEKISPQFEPQVMQFASESSPTQSDKSRDEHMEQTSTRTPNEIKAERQKKLKEKTSEIALKLKLSTSQLPAEPAAILRDSKDQKSTELRLFVGRLNPSFDAQMLRSYFSKFGEVVDIHFPLDAEGHGRGFAFVTFSHFFGEHPTEIPLHEINGSTVHVDVSSYHKYNGGPTQTLMISGIIQNTPDEKLVQHFSKYGEIVGIVRHKESRKKFSRWAFVHFQDFESVEKALEDVHTIDGLTIDCRRAQNFTFEVKKEAEWKKQKPKGKSSPPQPSPPKPALDIACPEVKKIQVSCLAPQTTAEKLKQHFARFGQVIDAYVPIFWGTANSKCFGYIVVPTSDVDKFFQCHHVIDGRSVVLTNEDSRCNPDKALTLLVSAGPAIMSKVSEDDLKKFFARFGKIISVRKPQDPFTKKPSHYGFVQFTSSNAVEKAIENFAYRINGQIVTVTKSRFDPYK